MASPAGVSYRGDEGGKKPRDFAERLEASVLSEEEAKAIMKAGLGKAEAEFAASLTAPLYWTFRERDTRRPRVRNGSAFFLDAGEGVFGVTAAHVIDGLRSDQEAHGLHALQLGHDLSLDLTTDHAIIAMDAQIDIATFRITKTEVLALGKTILTGDQKSWPPAPPELNKGVSYAGFPGCETEWQSRTALSFGIACGAGIAHSISHTDISVLIERDYLIDVLGCGLPPENFNFQGMSGGPMLTIVEQNGIRRWRLAGVIYAGPNTSEEDAEAIRGLEIIKARRAHFIRPDGRLDISLWEGLHLN